MRTSLGISMVAVLTAVGALSGCDKSWREENFRIPDLGQQGSGVDRPRPSATVAPPADDTSASEDPALPDGGAGPELTADASIDGSHDDAGSPVASTPDAADARGDESTEADPGDSSDDSTNEPVAPENFSKRALLRAAAGCAEAQHRKFSAAATALANAVSALPATPTGADFSAVHSPFAQAMTAFQVVEQFRVGPAARAMDPGGQDLRDWIYSFPQVNRCQIDRNLVREAYAGSLDGVLLNARGLAALEYLLFYQGAENACSMGIDINSLGTWAALSTAERDTRRAAYAKALANDVVKRAEALVHAWESGGGNFAQQLIGAGAGSDVFASEQAALNALGHALFYIEKEVKDYKLGWPLGMVAECTTGHCPEASESPYARLSASNIAANVEGFRLLFQGCGDSYDGVGFDDWLRAVNPDDDLAERMIEGLDGIQVALSELTLPLEDAFYDAPAEARALHAAVKRLTDPLKTEFVTVLNIDLPMTAEGDND